MAAGRSRSSASSSRAPWTKPRSSISRTRFVPHPVNAQHLGVYRRFSDRDPHRGAGGKDAQGHQSPAGRGCHSGRRPAGLYRGDGSGDEERATGVVSSAEADGHGGADCRQRRDVRMQTGTPAGGAGHRSIRLFDRHHQLPQPGRLSQRTHRQGDRAERRRRPHGSRQPGQFDPSAGPIR